MTNTELGLARLHNPDDETTRAMLAGVLDLASDAVIVFDGSGSIVLANDEAERVIGPDATPSGIHGLVGRDVRSVFPMSYVDPWARNDKHAFPFALDGSASSVVCVGRNGIERPLVVRCKRVAAAGETFVLAAHAHDQVQAANNEHDRLEEELRRANQRLSGTLSIVIGTIDSSNVAELFSRMTQEIARTMDAAGSIFYLTNEYGFVMRDRSPSLENLFVPPFIPLRESLDERASFITNSVRLSILPPRGDSLRQGPLEYREVIGEKTHKVYQFKARLLPPFVSFIAVPVWAGRNLLAMIEVGWLERHPTHDDDARLLDAVAKYLSVQLVGAISLLREKHERQLRDAQSSIREALMAADATDEAGIGRALIETARVLDAHVVFLQEDDSGNYVFMPADDATPARRIDRGDLEPRDGMGGADVLPILPESPLGELLEKWGMPSVGAMVTIQSGKHQQVVGFILREAYEKPFDEPELSFLEHVAHDVFELAHGGEVRRQEKRISQALQTGMKNELQRVPGISAEGVYSSATQEAFVGGDFYDLIRLPDNRACVIMGDVSGKGVEAASVSAAVRTALAAYSWQGMSPANMVSLLNQFLLGFSRLETFATLFVGIIDIAQGVLTYCSAGHPPAMLVRAKSGLIETLDVQSSVVGAFQDMEYQDGSVEPCTGDILLLYTDGTTEARARDRSFFGEDGLRDALAREVPRGFEGLPSRLLETLERFTGHQLKDDVAIVALRLDQAHV